MKNELKQLLLSLKIGDGCYVTQNSGNSYSVMFNGIRQDYIEHKANVLCDNELIVKPIECYSGYVKGKKLFGYRTWVSPEVTEVGQMSVSDVINSLDILGLIYYFLDDGSLHKAHNTYHIYCNSFTVEEVNVLLDLIYKYFPQQRGTIRWDRKKDGREFPYIYLPRVVAELFSTYIQEFLIDHDISSLLYKTIDPQRLSKA